jgi:hypothetical protein
MTSKERWQLSLTVGWMFLLYDSSEGVRKFRSLYIAIGPAFGSDKVLWRSWLSRPLHIFYHPVSRGRSAVRSRMGLTFCFGLQTVSTRARSIFNAHPDLGLVLGNPLGWEASFEGRSADHNYGL